MKEYSETFYKSKTWQKCRDGYLRSVGGLCEICLQRGYYVPAEIVHHKKHITPNNIDNPQITLDWKNLQAVCSACHNKLHKRHGFANSRYTVDASGHVEILQD